MADFIRGGRLGWVGFIVEVSTVLEVYSSEVNYK